MSSLKRMAMRMGGTTTSKDVTLNNSKYVLENHISDDPTYRDEVQILNKGIISCRLTNYRKDGDAPARMDIQATLENEFWLGDVFLVKDVKTGVDSHWICTDRSNFFGIYYKGLVRECNQLFRFQNGTSEVLEYWGFTENPYSTTLSTGNIVTYPTNKLNFTMPYNDDTMKIYIDKRFVTEIGYNENGDKIPIVYKITSRESNTTNFSGGRFLKLMAEFSQYTINDNVEQMIADYRQSDNENITNIPNKKLLHCEISGANTIKCGGNARNYRCTFYLKDCITENLDVIPVWKIKLPIGYETHQNAVNFTQNKNDIELSCNNEQLIGIDITLELSDSEGLYDNESFGIKVVSYI